MRPLHNSARALQDGSSSSPYPIAASDLKQRSVPSLHLKRHKEQNSVIADCLSFHFSVAWEFRGDCPNISGVKLWGNKL